MILIAITKVKPRVVSWSYILTQDFVFILRPTIFFSLSHACDDTEKHVKS